MSYSIRSHRAPWHHSSIIASQKWNRWHRLHVQIQAARSSQLVAGTSPVATTILVSAGRYGSRKATQLKCTVLCAKIAPWLIPLHMCWQIHASKPDQS